MLFVIAAREKRALSPFPELGFFYFPMSVSYFISRETLIAAPSGGMSVLRKKLFLWMWRTAVSAMDFFRLPTNRVVELGTQVTL